MKKYESALPRSSIPSRIHFRTVNVIHTATTKNVAIEYTHGKIRRETKNFTIEKLTKHKR